MANAKCIGLVVCSLCVVFLAAVGLTVFFLYPRIPSVEEDHTVVNQFYLNISLVEMNATVFINVSNQNYVEILLKSLSLNVTHKPSGKFLGTVTVNPLSFHSKQVTIFGVPVVLSSTDPTTLLALNQEFLLNGYITIELKGPLVASYLSYVVDKDLDLTEQISKP